MQMDQFLFKSKTVSGSKVV